MTAQDSCAHLSLGTKFCCWLGWSDVSVANLPPPNCLSAYARMKRRLSVVDDVPARLSTKIAPVGLGLIFGESNRLSLDYVSVGRPARQEGYIRMAETPSGAPMTGHGPELSFQTDGGPASGAMQWRFSLASMSRPERDFGLGRRVARPMTPVPGTAFGTRLLRAPLPAPPTLPPVPPSRSAHSR